MKNKKAKEKIDPRNMRLMVGGVLITAIFLFILVVDFPKDFKSISFRFLAIIIGLLLFYIGKTASNKNYNDYLKKWKNK